MNISSKEIKPVVVCICGSTRFSEHFKQASITETLSGKIVLSIGCNMREDNVFKEMTKEELEKTKEMLDYLHFKKIELADEVLVLNVGGYIGYSTSREINYANKLNKLIRYLEDEHEHFI